MQAKCCRRDAAQRDASDADLAPEVQVAPAIRAFGFEFFHGCERILADGAKLHRVGGFNPSPSGALIAAGCRTSSLRRYSRNPASRTA
jgi:hypothetical protein